MIIIRLCRAVLSLGGFDLVYKELYDTNTWKTYLIALNVCNGKMF